MEEKQRVRLPKKGEIFGIAESILGAYKVRVRCEDEKIRLCRIRGTMRKRNWVNEGNLVLVKPWEIQGDEKGDIIWVYRKNQARWLKRKGKLKMDIDQK